MKRVLFQFLLLVPLALPAAAVDYLKEVKPVLAERCFACHGVLKQKGGLRLDTAEFMQKGGKHGAAMVPGKAGESPLVARISSHDDDERMPPEGHPLKDDEIAAIKRWIQEGAKAPADERAENDPREHWAFKAPVRPAVPKVKDAAWAKNPIDAFIAAKREPSKLKPQGAADRQLWLRRVSLDLIGLPPSVEEMRAFAADKSPQAYEKVVDRLLASPQYGERWGRHWMDVWRYSDWHGLGAQLRNSQKHIWRWRDWIVDSLNADKGYNRMVEEMLAGDEIAPTDPDVLRATGYLARDYYLFNRTTWLENTVEHTGKAFLGLTINCSKCHDHKYDPVSQQEYYGWRAIFEPYHVRLDAMPGQPDLEKDGLPRVYDLHLDKPTYLFVRGDEKNPDTNDVIAPTVPAVLAFGDFKAAPVTLPMLAHNPAMRPFVYEDQRQQWERQAATAKETLTKAEKNLANWAAKNEGYASTNTNHLVLKASVQLAEKSLATAQVRVTNLAAAWRADVAKTKAPVSADAKALIQAAAVANARLKLAQAEEAVAQAEVDQFNAKKAAAAKKGLPALQEAVKKALAALDKPGETYVPVSGSLKALDGPTEKEDTLRLPFPETSTGRRTALAHWLTDARNPLVARVAVNHLWARHFGQPLVATMADFGRRGAVPSHPELLDWLAVELRDNGWSMKRLHRLMVLSKTYQMESSNAGAAAVNLRDDPENKLYWRMNPLRMEAQVLRDSLLSLAGQLDLKMGGPTLDPAKENDTFRRSLYFTHSPENPNKFLDTFDNASTVECYRRPESVLPQQALALANSKLALLASQKIAEREGGELGDAEFAKRVFEMILGARPNKAEVAACVETLGRLEGELKGRKVEGARMKARADLVQALLNHNDFITVR